MKAEDFLNKLHIADRKIIGKRVKVLDTTIQHRYTLIELLNKYKTELTNEGL